MSQRIGYLLKDYWSSAHVTTDEDTTACGETVDATVAGATLSCQACRALLGDAREPSMVLVDPEGLTHHGAPVLVVLTGASMDLRSRPDWRVKCVSWDRVRHMTATVARPGARVSCLTCLATSGKGT